MKANNEKPKQIAVVGSGLAGLVAAWKLSQTHHVTLYEKHAALGMDAHSIDLQHEGKTFRIDVPLRVIYPGYYRQLLKLYEQLGIQTEPVSYSASFSLASGEAYFRYNNRSFGSWAIPTGSPRLLLKEASRDIVLDLFRFFRSGRRDFENGCMNDISISEYLEAAGYSRWFRDGFIYPSFAGICTCTLEAVKDYPAELIIRYLNEGLLFQSVRRVNNGTKDVVNRLSRSIQSIKLSTGVTRISQHSQGPKILDDAGRTAAFDHVVMASQANQSARMIEEDFQREATLLNEFQYEKSSVVMHKDDALAPRNKKDWSPINFWAGSIEQTPMATIWMNSVQPELNNYQPVFQTWNPTLRPKDESILSEAHFERPMVGATNGRRAVQALESLHNEPKRRLWFCGSYANYNVPLLESACSSALRVAKQINLN